MKRVAIIVGLVLALLGALGGVYRLGHQHGYSEAEAGYQKQQNEQQAAMALAMHQARTESRARLDKREVELRQQLQISNDRIRELLESNNEFTAWYQARAPTAVAELLFDDNSMQQ